MDFHFKNRVEAPVYGGNQRAMNDCMMDFDGELRVSDLYLSV